MINFSSTLYLFDPLQFPLEGVITNSDIEAQKIGQS